MKEKNKNWEEVESKIVENILNRIENKEISEDEKELERNILNEVKKENYLNQDWEEDYAVERMKEKIQTDIKDKIKPVSFGEEMKNPTGVFIIFGFIVFIIIAILLLILNFSGKINLHPILEGALLFATFTAIFSPIWNWLKK